MFPFKFLDCKHRHQTTPRKDERGEYRRCLDCSARIPWSWCDDISISQPIRTQERKPQLTSLTGIEKMQFGIRG